VINMAISEELVLDLYRVGAIKFGKFRLTSGIESPIYVDLRITITYPSIYRQLVKAMSELLSNYEFDVVAGIETAGIPWASMIAYELGKGLVYVRKEAKGHGTARLIEGDLRKGTRVFLIDDVITTGGSIIRAINALREQGGDVVGVAVFVDREQGGIDVIRREGINATALMKLSFIMNILLSRGVVDRALYDEVMRYLVSVRVPQND